MKKNILVFGIAVSILMNSVPAAIAGDDAFTKFGRGMANIVTSPGELYAQPWLLSEDHTVSTAIFGGLLKGFAMFLAREAVGLYEVITFPFPIPKGYRPIIEPPTTFTNWNERQLRI